MAEIIDNRKGEPLKYEGGSVIITRPSVTNETLHDFEGEKLTNRQILSRINESGGGLSFADGGEIPEEIFTTGKTYKYGGQELSDEHIVSSCGCKHKTKQLAAGVNSQFYEEFKKGGWLAKPELSFEQFKKQNHTLYRVNGKLMLPVIVGHGYETYWSDKTTAAEAMQDIYSQYAQTQRMAKGGQNFVFFTDQFDVKKAYDLLHSGTTNYEVKEIDTQFSKPSSFNRFNQDYAENLSDDIDYTQPQGIMIRLPEKQGLPAADILIDGNHRSHNAKYKGIDKMPVYYISNPETIKKFQRSKDKHSSRFAVGGLVHSYGTMSFNDFARGYGKYIYREPNAQNKQEWVSTLPTTYGHKVFTSLAPTYGGALRDIYAQYLKEKDRYAYGGQTEGDYQYALTIRPFGIGTYPEEGFSRYEPSDVYKFGILHYSEKLSIDRVMHFSLCPITELEALDGKRIKWFEDYEGLVTLEKDEKGKIIAVKVMVTFKDEVIPERMAYNKFLQKYYQGKWGAAYEEGGEMESGAILYPQTADEYLTEHPEQVLVLVNNVSRETYIIEKNISGWGDSRAFILSKFRQSGSFEHEIESGYSVASLLERIPNKEFSKIYFGNSKGEAVLYFEGLKKL